MGQMLSFVNDTHADVDMAYDFVCEQLDISSFVDNETAWNDFYDTWEAATIVTTCSTLSPDLFTPLTNIIMQESKFLVYGQHVRPHDGYTRNDCLSYMAETA